MLLLALAACGASAPDDTTSNKAASGAAPAAGYEETGHGESGHDESGHDEGSGAEGGHEEEAERAIALSPAQIDAAGIEVATVASAVIRESLPLYGVVAPNAVRVRAVAARFPGMIRSVTKNIGDAVRQGEVLATVESNESLQTYAVAAPLDGVVTARNANPGEQAGDAPLFTVADLSTVWVELSLFPRDVAKVHVGQTVRVKSPDTGLSAEGRVIYVAPFGQAANQTLTARVLLDNPAGHWKPGLYVTAEVTLAETQALRSVRTEAVQSLEGRDVVFVLDDDGFEPRRVRIGRSDADYTELLDGLEAGDRYATRNSFVLKAELGKGEAEHGH